MPGFLRTSEPEIYLCRQDSEELGTHKESIVKKNPELKSRCDKCYAKSLNLEKMESQVVLKTQKQKEFAQVQIQEVLEGNNKVTAT